MWLLKSGYINRAYVLAETGRLIMSNSSNSKRSRSQSLPATKNNLFAPANKQISAKENLAGKEEMLSQFRNPAK